MAKAPQLIDQCSSRLGLTTAELLSIAQTAPNRYYVWDIPKRSGGKRIVCHPARKLKPIQEYFLQNILHALPVHSSATAYVKGSSIKRNALEHCFSRVILKLDFADFFNSIKVSSWRTFASDHFPDWTAEEVEFSTKILFWGNRTNTPRCLAVGAPTSPHLSNVLTYEIDEVLHSYAARHGLNYTRYADDITFSSVQNLDRAGVIGAVRDALRSARYTHLSLNEAKTRLVSNGFQRRVTGLIITPDRKISLGRDRKRLISAMCHHYSEGRLGSCPAEWCSWVIAKPLASVPSNVP